MEKKPEEIYAEQWLKETAAELEIKSFAPEEMVACPKCARKSPPTRLKCFYCGADLPLAEIQTDKVKPQLRKLEDWEKGFNVILLPGEKNIDEAKLTGLAETTRLETEDLRRIFKARTALPLARVESETEAEIVRKKIADAGFESVVIADETLKPETAARRLRGLEFRDDALVLILFNADEVAEIRRGDLVLIVSGALFERRIEATEKRKKRETKIQETTEISADEILVDIYPQNDSIGYRIVSTGFDFSCLGAEKGILARENMARLAERLRAFAPAAKFVDDYLQIRDLLGRVWEVEQKKDSRGLQRRAFGRFNLENVTTINNLAQFTKYSRLKRQLL